MTKHFALLIKTGVYFTHCMPYELPSMHNLRRALKRGAGPRCPEAETLMTRRAREYQSLPLYRRGLFRIPYNVVSTTSKGNAVSDAEQPVVARLKRAQESIGLQKSQSESAAVAISLYINVVHGLRNQAPEDQIHSIAATLTAGMLAAPNNT